MSHTVEQYSSVGLTSVLYAICFMSCVKPCRFLLKNPSVRLAFVHMESICVLNFRFVENVEKLNNTCVDKKTKIMQKSYYTITCIQFSYVSDHKHMFFTVILK